MKFSLFAFLLFPLILSAQNGEPVSDTSYITAQGGIFSEVKTFIYADGSELSTKTPIGDSLALAAATKARIESTAASMAVDVRYVSTFKKKITTLVRESNAVLALTGIDPQKQVQDEYSAPFLTAGWALRHDGTTADIAFTVNAQGNLRYSVAGGTTRQAQLLGAVLRLKQYPAQGTDTDVYRLQNGVYVNADRSIILRPPGNNSQVSRSAAPAPATKKAKKG